MQKRQTKQVTTSDGKTVYRRKTALGCSHSADSQNDEPVPHVPASIREVVESIHPRARLLSYEQPTLTLQLTGPSGLPKLPVGYYFKGGAARELLRRVLFPELPQQTVRDFDIVRLAETSDENDHRLAIQFMSDDYQFGHGVEVVEDRAAYFRSRDLTVNEVLFHARTLECTVTALLDLATGVLRPTSHVSDTLGTIDSITVMKLLRLAAENTVSNIPVTIEGLPPKPDVFDFDIALHLDRSFVHSHAAAEEYLLLSWQHKLLMPEREAPPPVVDAVKHLSERIRQGLPFFKNLPLDVIKQLR